MVVFFTSGYTRSSFRHNYLLSALKFSKRPVLTLCAKKGAWKKARANCFKISLPIQHEISWNPSNGAFTLPETPRQQSRPKLTHISTKFVQNPVGILCCVCLCSMNTSTKFLKSFLLVTVYLSCCRLLSTHYEYSPISLA